MYNNKYKKRVGDNIMTVGEYLQKLFDEKNLSVSDISKQIGLKSRSSIYRLLRSNGVTDNQINLINKIDGVVNFSSDEKKEIKNLIGISSRPLYASSRNILSALYQKKNNMDVYHYDGEKQTSLSDIFSKLTGKMHICILEILPQTANTILENIISSKKYIQIDHFLELNRLRLTIANEILTLIKLSKYDNYTPYLCKDQLSDDTDIIVFSDIQDSEPYMTLIKFYNNKISQYAISKITSSMYRYVLSNLEKRKQSSDMFKKSVSTVKDYVHLADSLCNMYLEPFFHFEGTPRFSFISSDMFRELISDINFFGYPKDHDYIQKLCKAFDNFDEAIKPGKKADKYLLLDKNMVKNTMRSGYTFGHPKDFRPLSRKQIKAYFMRLIKLASYDDSILHIRFAKDFSITDSFAYSPNNILCLNNMSECVVQNDNIFDIMNDFSHYIWDNLTFSDKESRIMLENMIKYNL